MVAANGHRAGVANDSAAVNNQFRGASTNVEQAAAQVAFILRQARFRRSQRLEHRVANQDARFIRGRNQILRGGHGGSDYVNIGFQAMADHANRITDAFLRVHAKFVRKNVKNFAVIGKRNVTSGVDGTANIFAFDITWARAQGDSAAAVHAAHMIAGNADHGRLHRNVRHALGFFHSTPNGAHGGIQINNQTFAQALGFRGAQSEKIDLLFVDFSDHRAGFCAADIQPDDVFISLAQRYAPARTTWLSRPLPPRWSQGSRSLAENTVNRWTAHDLHWLATVKNFRPACDIWRQNLRCQNES